MDRTNLLAPMNMKSAEQWACQFDGNPADAPYRGLIPFIRQIQADALRWAASAFRGNLRPDEIEDKANRLDPVQKVNP